MPDSFVLAFVPGVTPGKWVGVWKQRMPRIHIDVRPQSADEALHSLRDGTAHVALLRLPFADDGLSVIPLYSETPVVVAPKDHPIAAFDALTQADLAGETVLPGQDAAVVELVAANVGLALMPASIARLHGRKDVVARPITDAEETRIALVWVTERTVPWIEEFVGIVRGRTANSSRGEETPPTPKVGPAKAAPKRKPGRPSKPRR